MYVFMHVFKPPPPLFLLLADPDPITERFFCIHIRSQQYSIIITAPGPPAASTTILPLVTSLKAPLSARAPNDRP